MHDYAHGKTNLSSGGIVINCFENNYCQMYIRLNTGVVSVQHSFQFRNLLLCFRVGGRISNNLIFMRHFFHQANKSFYLQSLIFNFVSIVWIRSSKNRHVRGKVENILLPNKQKLRKALPDARKSIQKRIGNNQWTYCNSFM